MIKFIAFTKAYIANKDGATAIEYGLIAAGISLAIATAVFTFGGSLVGVFETMDTTLTSAGAGGTP